MIAHCIEWGRTVIGGYGGQDRMAECDITGGQILAALRGRLRTESRVAGKWRYCGSKNGINVIFTFDTDDEGNLLVIVTLIREDCPMKCTECGNAMTKTIGDHVYRESGMSHVVLRNVPLYDCESCGAHRVVIERMAQLHRLLAHIIATKPARLVPSEVHFLRDHLELTNRDFATLMGVSETQASRWTSAEPIGVPAERFLRVIATMGPIVIAAGPPTVKLGKVKEGEFIALPSKDEEAKEMPVRIRRTPSDWKQEQPAAA